MKKSILAVAGIAALAGVAVPMGAYADLTTTQTDNLSVTIENNCELKYDSTTPHTGGTTKGTWTDAAHTLSVTVANSSVDKNIGSTKFNVTCNDTGGYQVKLTASALKIGENGDTIAFAGSEPTSGVSSWGVYNGTSWIAGDGTGVAKSSADPVSGGDFTVTYGIATSSTQEAGTYTGTALYTLSHPKDK